MSELGQLETFPALARMSVPGGKADEIGTITDIGQRMSAVGGRADVLEAWPESLLLANTGSSADNTKRSLEHPLELAEPLLARRG
jgi:hypothetical protein